jgi:glycerophosphoryl diester phosphodiesterase
VDGIELDVRLTTDDEVVVVHDARLDGRRICDIARADLPALIPDLTDALDACAGMTVIVEVKNFAQDEYFDPGQRLVHRVVEILAGDGRADDVIVSSFGWDALDVVRRDAPHLTTAALMFAREPDPAQLVAAADRGHRLAHPYDAMVDPAFVSEAERLGLALDVWLLDVAPERYAALAALDVHGVITGQPAAALAAARR